MMGKSDSGKRLGKDLPSRSSTAQPDDYNLYEYCVLRYVPDVVRGEALNVGLLMMCKRRRWIKCEVRVDRERLLRVWPDCDPDALSRHLELFKLHDVPVPGLPVEETYRWLAAMKSAVIQPSASHPGIITDSPEETFSHLVGRLL